jgi:hypothetical protein
MLRFNGSERIESRNHSREAIYYSVIHLLFREPLRPSALTE